MKSCLIFIFLWLSITSFSQVFQEQTSGTTSNLRHVHFVSSLTGWAVGENGTVIKTTNGGANWFSQNINSPSEIVIGCFFTDSLTGWVGGSSVYKTTDGGSTWATQVGCYGITKFYFLNSQTGWAVGGSDGSTNNIGEIYKTTNGGITWSLISDNTSWTRFYGVQFTDENNGWAYAEKNGLLVRTTNGGTSWQTLLNNSTNLIRGIYFKDSNNGWYVGRSNTSGLSMKTNDGGLNWNNIAGNIQFQLSNVFFTDNNTGWASSSSQAGRGIRKTTDGGVTWNLDYINSNGLNSNSIYFVNPTTGWAVGEGGSIVKINVNGWPSEISNSDIKNKDVKIYINKNTNYITIEVSNPEFKNAKINIIDLTGKVIFSTYCMNNITEYNNSKLANGVYFVNIKNHNKSITQKVIKE